MLNDKVILKGLIFNFLTDDVLISMLPGILPLIHRPIEHISGIIIKVSFSIENHLQYCYNIFE